MVSTCSCGVSTGLSVSGACTEACLYLWDLAQNLAQSWGSRNVSWVKEWRLAPGLNSWVAGGNEQSPEGRTCRRSRFWPSEDGEQSVCVKDAVLACRFLVRSTHGADVQWATQWPGLELPGEAWDIGSWKYLIVSPKKTGLTSGGSLFGAGWGAPTLILLYWNVSGKGCSSCPRLS